MSLLALKVVFTLNFSLVKSGFCSAIQNLKHEFYASPQGEARIIKLRNQVINISWQIYIPNFLSLEKKGFR